MKHPRVWTAIAMTAIAMTFQGCATPEIASDVKNENVSLVSFGLPKGVLGSVAQRGHMIIQVSPTTEFAKRFGDSRAIKISEHIGNLIHSSIETDAHDLVTGKKVLMLNFSLGQKNCFEGNPASKAVFKILDHGRESELATYIDPLGCPLTQSNLSFQ